MNALEEKVLELIGEDPAAPDVFTDDDEGMAPVRDSLNDAVQEIVMLTGAHKRTYVIPLRAEQGLYRIVPVNGELGWVTDAWLVNQKRRLEQTDLLRLSVYDPRWMVTTGSPRSYFPIGADVIGVWPKPSASSDVLELTVVEVPAAYGDGDRVKVRDSFQYALVNYAVAEYWASRGDAVEAQKHMGLYLDALGLREQYMPHQSGGFQTRKEPWPVETK